jgi:hypothetical protein
MTKTFSSSPSICHSIAWLLYLETGPTTHVSSSQSATTISFRPTSLCRDRSADTAPERHLPCSQMPSVHSFANIPAFCKHVSCTQHNGHSLTTLNIFALGLFELCRSDYDAGIHYLESSTARKMAEVAIHKSTWSLCKPSQPRHN